MSKLPNTPKPFLATPKKNTSGLPEDFNFKLKNILNRKKFKQKKVAIIGWLGAFNLGDEMMLDVTVKEMKRRGHTLTLLAHKIDDKVRSRYAGHKIVARRPLSDESLNKVLEENDTLFVNGGALIDDDHYENDGSLARDISRLARQFIDNDKNVIVYGVSTNAELKNQQLIDDYSYIIDNASLFTVRDEFSKAELAKNADAEKIQVVDDIEFADEVITTKPRLLRSRKIISLIAVFNEGTIGQLKTLFEKIIDQSKASIRVISFFDEDDNDAKYIEKLKNELGDKRFAIDEISSPTNSEELYNALTDSEVVVSMRYHGSLFANAIGKPVITIDYDNHPHYLNKNKYLLDQYGYGKSTIKLSHINELAIHDVEKLLDSTESTDTNIAVIHKRARFDLLRAIDLV